MNRKNPFKKYYDLSNNETSVSKFKNLPSFPRYIDIELTNSCNFKCLMCPTGNLSQTRKTGFMSDDVFDKVLVDIKPHLTPLRFIRWGEPTLHPNFVDYIQKSHNLGILTHMNTNGSKLDDLYMENIINAGLNSIKFSFQGVDRKSYDEMRRIDFYDDLIDTIKRFVDIRGDREYPFVQVSTSVTYENKDIIKRFRERLEDIVDKVTIGRTVLGKINLETVRLKQPDRDLLEKLRNEESVVKKHLKCPEVFDKLSINWDGTVSACCTDYDNLMTIGDVSNDSLENIWNSKKMNQYRSSLSRMEHYKNKLCSTCYDYASIQSDNIQKI